MSNRPYFYKQKPGKPGGHLFRKVDGTWQRKEMDGTRWKTLHVIKGEPPDPKWKSRSTDMLPEPSINEWKWR
jgi:hypothetical protein